MKMHQLIPALFLLGVLACCNAGEEDPAISPQAIPADSTDTVTPRARISIDSKDQSPENIVAYARTLIGVPYQYGSTDPAIGFDCSGFITHVFNHFNITVPRSSIDFTNVGQEVDRVEAATGDLILFTGTDTLETAVGHMGIVTENTDSLRFIHSTSGKKYGVTITALNEYYLKRFVKVIRIF